MEAQTYHGYQIWGHAILQQDEILQPERFAASGTITQNNKLVEASGVLGVFDTEDDARSRLEWAPGSTATAEPAPAALRT